MANCSQTNNTTIIGTSAVSYDSTPLPCTDVKACDDLNTILTKFDNVICSAINSVNILSEEVMNITEDLMIITEEIENINDQIFICCPICDFTITATELPVCEFTATATELPICNFTGSVNQLPDPTTTTTSSSSTSTSTSTSTSSSTTTTTTTDEPTTTTTSTTLYPCIESDLLIVNQTESTIAEVYADPPTIVWVIGTPVGPLATSDGSYNGTSNSIKVDISNYINGGCINMYINTVLIQSIPFSSDGTYTFDSSSLVNGDCLWFIITDVCP